MVLISIVAAITAGPGEGGVLGCVEIRPLAWGAGSTYQFASY